MTVNTQSQTKKSLAINEVSILDKADKQQIFLLKIILNILLKI